MILEAACFLMIRQGCRELALWSQEREAAGLFRARGRGSSRRRHGGSRRKQRHFGLSELTGWQAGRWRTAPRGWKAGKNRLRRVSFPFLCRFGLLLHECDALLGLIKGL